MTQPAMSTGSDVLESEHQSFVNWDLSGLVDDASDAALTKSLEQLEQELASLVDSVPADRDGRRSQWIEFLLRMQDIDKQISDVWSYHYCRYREDTSNDARRMFLGKSNALQSQFDQLTEQVVRHLDGIEGGELGVIVSDRRLADLSDKITSLVAKAHYLLPKNVEHIAADLRNVGMSNWETLYDQISSNLSFRFQNESGKRVTSPISGFQSLQSHSSAKVRRSALKGVEAAWSGVEAPVGACLNGIMGMRLVDLRHRSQQDFLEAALSDHKVSVDLNHQVLAVAKKLRPALQRFLRTKARVFGRRTLGFQDLFARIPQSDSALVDIDAAKKTILDAFRGVSTKLAACADEVFDSHWLETEQREGRGFFGFCVPFIDARQVRVYSPYGGSFTDLTVLAHELGHAYHVKAMQGLAFWQLDVPMPLAETASNVGEGLLRGHLRNSADMSAEQELAILEVRLSKAARALLFWSVLYDFEVSAYRERVSGDLSADRLSALMREAQLVWYGDAINPNETFDHLWAHVPLYYMSDQSLHSLAYIFGFLFSEVLLERLSDEPNFDDHYERLLRQTGAGTVDELITHGLGEDPKNAVFWDRVIEPIENDVSAFEHIAAEIAAAG